jgi:hypothetical protein
MSKHKFIYYIIVIFFLTAVTASLLYQNPVVVRSQKQTVTFQSNGDMENKSKNDNGTSNISRTSPTIGWELIESVDPPTSTPILATPIPISVPLSPVFNVTTVNYQCTTGDPSLAIQNAINSLPQNRTQPLNVTLQGVFNFVQDIVLESNINFIGQNAVLIGVNNTNIFTLNPNETIFSEVHKVFSIDGYDSQFVDWINLHNVTFQSINFQHPLEPASGDFAIYCYQSNSTGWGINDNINIINCTFNGFYTGFYGLPINSRFENNFFSNFTSNGFMLPYGLNITIKNNTFDTRANKPEILSYAGNYPIIGLHLLDVNVSAIVINNTFITGDLSVGLAIVSSTGNITVTKNIFMGDGQPVAVDFYQRPFSTEGLEVYDNIGQSDFSVP